MNSDSKKLFEEILPSATNVEQSLNSVINTLSMESTMDDPIEQGFQASYNRLVVDGFIPYNDKEQFTAFSIWCASKGYKIYLDEVTTEPVLDRNGNVITTDCFIVKLVDNPFTPEVKTRIENIMKGYQRRHPKEKNFSPKVKDQIDLASILLKAYQTTDSKEASMAFNREWQLYKNQPKKEPFWAVALSISTLDPDEEDDVIMCHSIRELFDGLRYAKNVWPVDSFSHLEFLEATTNATNNYKGSLRFNTHELDNGFVG